MSQLRFLVVDDSQTMRKIVMNSLKRIGYDDYVEAENGLEALKILKSDSTINFVITDWNMPVLTGIDLLRAIRENEDFGSIPVLMVTTRMFKEDVMQAIQAKVNNYIVKPFTPQVLKEKIDLISSTLS